MRIYLKSVVEGAKEVTIDVGKTVLGRGTLLDVSAHLPSPSYT